MRVLVTSDWQLTVAQTNCSASIFNFGTAEMAASQKFGYPALDILCMRGRVKLQKVCQRVSCFHICLSILYSFYGPSLSVPS